MRAIRTAVKGLIPLAAIVALMAIPSVASAAPAKWTEYDGDPIGTVTANFTGNIDVEILGQGQTITSTCQVTGQVELSNSGTGGTATQKLIGLQAVDIDGPGPYVCNGYWMGCPVTQSTYSTPWTGATTVTQGVFKSRIDSMSITTTWCGSGPTIPLSGPLDSMRPLNVLVNGRGCVGKFQIPDVRVLSSPGNPYWGDVNGLLTFNLNTMQGLSTNLGGPCVKVAAA